MSLVHCAENTIQYYITYNNYFPYASVTMFSSAINLSCTKLFLSHAMSKHYILIYFTSMPMIRIIMLINNIIINVYR